MFPGTNGLVVESGGIPASHATRNNKAFDVTPDGRRIVFDRIEENSDIVLIELETTES